MQMIKSAVFVNVKKQQSKPHTCQNRAVIYKHHLGPLFFLFKYNINQKHSPFLLVLSFSQVETDSWTASFKMYTSVYEPNTGKHASVSEDTDKGRGARSIYDCSCCTGPRRPLKPLYSWV